MGSIRAYFGEEPLVGGKSGKMVGGVTDSQRRYVFDLVNTAYLFNVVLPSYSSRSPNAGDIADFYIDTMTDRVSREFRIRRSEAQGLVQNAINEAERLVEESANLSNPRRTIVTPPHSQRKKKNKGHFY